MSLANAVIGPDDWLSNVDEDGQSFESFVGCFRNTPDKVHNTIYIQPLDGIFDEALLQLLENFGKLHFPTVTIKIRKPLKLESLGASTRVTEDGLKQYLAPSIIESIAK